MMCRDLQKSVYFLRQLQTALRIEALQKAHSHIDGEDAQFQRIPDTLFQLHNELKPLPVPLLDVVSANTILRSPAPLLPAVVHETFDPSASRSKIRNDDVIAYVEKHVRLRLLCDEIVPLPFLSSMEFQNGHLVLKAENLFSVKLSVDSLQPNAPFSVESFECLFLGASPNSSHLIVNEFQKRAVIEFINKELVSWNDSVLREKYYLSKESTEMDVDTDQDETKPNRTSLIFVFDTLARFCVKLALMSLFHQSSLFKEIQASFDSESSTVSLTPLCRFDLGESSFYFMSIFNR